MDIKWIKDNVQKDQFVLSNHAHEERQAESITVEDIKIVIKNGEIVEDYPDDPRGPSCLVLGYSNVRPLHIICGSSKKSWLKIITVYIPKPPKWETPKLRGKGG